MDSKTRNSLMNQMRNLALRSNERKAAKDACKVDKALYQCQKCSVKLYDGNSGKNFKIYEEQYTDRVLWQKIELDHIIPVSDNKNGWQGWDVFMEGLFCDRSNFQGLCKECHHIKTAKESAERAENKRKKKLDK